MTGGRRVVLHGDHTDGCGAPRLREGHTPGLLFAFRAGPGKLREGKDKRMQNYGQKHIQNSVADWNQFNTVLNPSR